MHGRSPWFRQDGSGRTATQQPQQQAVHLNPNFFPTPNLYFNPSFGRRINPFVPTPDSCPSIGQQFPNNFPIPLNSSAIFQTPVPRAPPNNANDTGKVPQQHGDLQKDMLGKLDRAVTRARRDLLTSNNYVSAWEVSQAALLMVKAESWQSLGFQMQQVPSLNRLIVTEGKINAFIHCFVGVRGVVSLHDLEVAICKSEGIERFEELELGPIIRNPLAVHYFSVPSELTEVHRIGTEEILSYLCDFMDTHKRKNVQLDSFLDFISEKQSVSGREKLCVRIQNIGMYTTQIKRAKQAEETVLQKCLEKTRKKASQKNKKRPLFAAQKKQLDDNFSTISQRIKYFSSENTQYGGKHTRFISSSDDDFSEDTDDDKDDKNTSSEYILSLPNSRTDYHSSCPYPSATEEKTRLGLTSEVACNPCTTGGVCCSTDNDQHRRKRKAENMSSNVSQKKLLKSDKFDSNFKKRGADNQVINDYSLSTESIKLFVTTWKDACRENNVEEVLSRMLQFYNVRKRKKVKSLFTSFPCVGLLNAAVSCIKFGMWDNMYDTFQTFNDRCTDGETQNSCDYIDIDVEIAKNVMPGSTQKPLTPKHSITFRCEDVAKKICGYFEDDVSIFKNHSREDKFIFLRKLCMCEQWVVEQYSVSTFESLGYGDYFTFLDRYMHLLPYLLERCLIGETSEKDSMTAYLLPLQFDVLVLQALSSLWDNKITDLQNISELLHRQFPLLCFKPLKTDVDTVTEILREKRITSNCLLFSAPLLRLNCTEYSSSRNEEKKAGMSVVVNSGPIERLTASVTTKDAIEVLLKAPMLIDLRMWSHWDYFFAPSLGSIVKWLLNEVNTKELLCLVTKDAKIIRINHSSTPDSFFEVLVEGSAFETAVELLSLFALYGGERSVPLALLKRLAQRAFEILINKSVEMELHDKSSLMNVKPSFNQCLVGKCTTGDLGSHFPGNGSVLIKPVSVISRFILDCLSFIPVEFCCFAADVLISGAQFFSKEVPSAILSECKQMEQRLMLHEVGLSIGLVEWVDDYNSFRSASISEFFHQSSSLDLVNIEFDKRSMPVKGISKKHSSSGENVVCTETDYHDVNRNRVSGPTHVHSDTVSFSGRSTRSALSAFDNCLNVDPVAVIDSIRREEFGINHNLSDFENKMLEKQHARLGRALHCLSQELYSQDSHFLLELVQNADDNIYPENVEPTLTFILQGKAIIVLNNEQGFFEKNIRALCDVGNSTKKDQDSGYIGKKGIGFKSVFRVTDSPEIHSNGFHIKFDIAEGQIGFVLPTVIPPCDVGFYTRLALQKADRLDESSGNTCIVLPFKSSISEGFALHNIVSLFSDLHPSLLLFLHKLRCIKFKNILDDSLVVMRKEIIGNGIVEVALGNDKMTWFVVSKKLQADVFRSDVHTTEISIAFTIQETHDQGYISILNQQPVFAFLPLRTYGLKVILQGDFVLPSSREEVDGSSPWNQWLLSEFPDLFVRAERSFCDLPCYRGIPGKAITTFTSFIPLVGEVHGFFSCLPRMIISKLRLSNCLLLDSDEEEWVLPCKVLRNWTIESRSLLSDSLIDKHLGLGFLNKDIVLSDSLARALGVEDYGPKILLDIVSSVCRSPDGLEFMGLSWLSSWISTLYLISSDSFRQTFSNSDSEADFIFKLRTIPFIPLLDGTYGSVDENTIWFHSDVVNQRNYDECGLEAFPKLYAKLRIVSPNLVAAAASVKSSIVDSTILDNVARMLYKIGVQKLSAHEVMKVHVLPVVSNEKSSMEQESLMIEYLSFAMFHLQSSCNSCSHEKGELITELCEKALILTNFGYKRPIEVPLHFSLDYGNPVDVNKLVTGMNMKWHEIDTAYLKHPITKSIPDGELKWRIFFQELGVTDFVQILQVEKRVADMYRVNIKDLVCGSEMISMDSVAKNWESDELLHLLSSLSTANDFEKSKYLLEILDRVWDDYFGDKINGCYIDSTGQTTKFNSSVLCILRDVPWIASSIDTELHLPKDLFNDCAAVNSVLGGIAPYTVPKVRSEKLLADIGLKTEVSLDDALSVLKHWTRSESPFKASVSQMSHFYAFIWKAIPHSKKKIIDELLSVPFIFLPHASCCSQDDTVPGLFFTHHDVYWNDGISSMDQVNYVRPECDLSTASYPLKKMLYFVYPNLHDFFVTECGVDERPPFCSYLQMLLQLSNIALPHQAAKKVFEVFSLWSDALKSGSLSLLDVEYLKESLLKKENTILPTRQDKWVSLHVSFGLVCWCNDNDLGKEFKNLEGIDFLYFGEFADDGNPVNQTKISTINRRLGIPALTEIVTREAIYYGPADGSLIFSLLNWILPYAQRYVFDVHPERYFQLKQSSFEDLRQLKIVVVEDLSYQNIIKTCKIASKKRHSCNCLLQDNILYCTRATDPHSIFMEFSRLMYNGSPNLHFANFLHMVTTMAESGATEEQTEFFILNSQKVPKLPMDEYFWSLQPGALSVEMDPMLVERTLEGKTEQNYSTSQKRAFTHSNWPPSDWKTAPGVKSVNSIRPTKVDVDNPHISVMDISDKNKKQIVARTDISNEFNVEDDTILSTSGAFLLDLESSGSRPNPSADLVSSNMNASTASVDFSVPSIINFNQSKSSERDLSGQQDALLTGRLGELTAFKYFVENSGSSSVSWVNKTSETGLPYDIVVDDDNGRGYIEVKATKVGRKNWFFITLREWQFAIEKGESFSIAHVILSDNNMARVTVYKNPARLCELGNMKLAVVVPKS